MADYKTLHGSHIEVVASDPSNPINGQVWYNTTSNVMKGFTSNPVGSWASGGNLNTARANLAGSGTQTAGLAFGGHPNVVDAETYNGSTWTEVANLNTGRRALGGSGTSTSSLAFGGNVTPPNNIKDETESWNGTAWTEVADLNTSRRLLSGAGADNESALAFGGLISTASAVNESWNGTSWTEVADLNTASYGRISFGIQAAAIAAGGDPGTIDSSETWNGTSWTEGNNLNQARVYGTGSGITTEGLAFGGQHPNDTLY